MLQGHEDFHNVCAERLPRTCQQRDEIYLLVLDDAGFAWIQARMEAMLF